jgi:hypothetical protein
MGLSRSGLFVNVSQILTVDKTELVEFSGKLSGSAAEAVRDGLRLLFERSD